MFFKACRKTFVAMTYFKYLIVFCLLCSFILFYFFAFLKKNMMDITDKKFKWCLEKGRTGGRKHRGLRKIRPDNEEANNHIQKALHNLEAVDYNIKGGFSDWAVSAAFCDDRSLS